MVYCIVILYVLGAYTTFYALALNIYILNDEDINALKRGESADFGAHTEPEVFHWIEWIAIVVWPISAVASILHGAYEKSQQPH